MCFFKEIAILPRLFRSGPVGSRWVARLMAAALLASGVVVAPGEAANTIVALEDDPLLIEISKGQLLRLDRPASTIFVAEPNIADIQVKSPTLIYVFGKAVGETTLYAVDARERVILARPLRITHNLSQLKAALRRVVPNGKIDAHSITGGLVLSGDVRTGTEAEDARLLAARFLTAKEEVLNRIRVTGPNQINLRVKIAEVSRTIIKDFGFNFDAVLTGAISGDPFTASLLQGVLPSTATRLNSVNNLTFNVTRGDFNINAVVDALEDEGLATVLAEPNLTATSGETASFLAGGEFPIPIPQEDNTIGIVFKKFGVSLSFTPTIIGDGRISLRVFPEVSQLSTSGSVEISGFSIPSLTTRRAETTVELGSGQSFAIAGLLQNNIDHDIKEYPGLADIPVLGALFRSTRFRRDETELMIIVTPYIVRPVNEKLAAPTDGLVAPSDIERILMGQIYRPQLPDGGGAPIDPKGGRLSGPVGFLLE